MMSQESVGASEQYRTSSPQLDPSQPTREQMEVLFDSKPLVSGPTSSSNIDPRLHSGSQGLQSPHDDALQSSDQKVTSQLSSLKKTVC
jgi:hypothetical protein